MQKWKLITLVLSAGVLFCSQIKDKPRPKKPGMPVTFDVPPGWPKPVYDFSNNPLTKEGIALGRKLFYDGILSKDGNFPCASCHQQIGAFGTFDHDLSHGFDNQHSNRNAPPLQNLAWQKTFHADGGINHLDVQPLAPITAPNEMGESIESVLKKLKSAPEYKPLFIAAFGDANITTKRMTQALSQFVLTMVSANSKFDKVMRGEDSFNLPQRLGYDIFQQKCASCHPPPMFTDYTFRNNGFAMEPTLRDSGRMRITGNPADSLKFKVPSLRNVMMTYPYAHDGRVFDIYLMLEHYKTGIIPGPTTDSLLKNKIPLSNFEKGQIVAFLMTLTDTTFLKNKALGPPEKK
jgi:cytochrome c peroxidase